MTSYDFKNQPKIYVLLHGMRNLGNLTETYSIKDITSHYEIKSKIFNNKLSSFYKPSIKYIHKGCCIYCKGVYAKEEIVWSQTIYLSIVWKIHLWYDTFIVQTKSRIKVVYSRQSIFTCQKKYVLDFNKTNKLVCKTSRFPSKDDHNN
ncbi:hypothetical protein CR513_28575, partial [Mucuna pruriens]